MNAIGEDLKDLQYTTELNIGAKKVYDCSDCNDMCWIPAEAENIHGAYKQCPCVSVKLAQQIELDRNSSSDALMKNTSQPALQPKIRNATLKSVVASGDGARAMIEFGKELLSGKRTFGTISGASGNAKTVFGSGMTNEFKSMHQRAAYFKLSELIEYMREGYSDGARLKKTDRYTEVISLDLLVVDEFDFIKDSSGWSKVSLTDFARNFISDLVDDRANAAMMEKPLKTVIIMNADFDNLPPTLKSRLYSGTKDERGFALIRNTDKDRRALEVRV